MGGDSQVGATAVGDPPTIDPANSLQLLLAEGIGPSEEDQIRFLNHHIDALQSRINNSSAANHPDPAEDDDGRSTNNDGGERRSSRSAGRGNKNKRKRKERSLGGPVDATTINRDRIKANVGSKTNQFVQFLDFVNMSDDDLEHIFVTDRTRSRFGRQGIIYPPRAFRRTAKQIKEWFNDMGAPGRNKRVAEADDMDVVIEHNSNMTWKNNEWVDTTGETKAPIPLLQPQQPCKCMGITIKYVNGIRVPNEARRDEYVLGFKYTCRESLTTRSKVSHPNNDEWQYAPPIIGSINNVNTGATRWTVEEDAHDNEESQYDHFHIRAVGCDGSSVLPAGTDLCSECSSNRRALLDRFDANIKLREGSFNPSTRYTAMERSGSLQKQHMEYHKRQSANKGKKLARRDKVIEQHLEETGIDVNVNAHTDFIFCDKVEKGVKEFLAKKVPTQDSIAEYAFKRAVHNHKVAKEKGAKAVRHCPLMIRLGATVRRAMGFKGGLYDLIAKVAGLPSDRTLRRYTVSNSNDPDGIMHSNCSRARSIFKRKYPKAGRYDYSRHCIIGLDSMHTKGRFGVSRNTNELVAVAEDAFEDEVIVKELEMLNNNDSEDEDAEMELPGMAKHFLVFIATTWSSEGKIQFLVARYGWPTITANKLAREIEMIIFNLAFYGFIVDTIAGDGAGENRLTWKNLCTISAREILVGQFTEEELDGLPLDFMIGFPHPHPMYGKKITVIIGGEMPHWGKKFRNAFDNKSRTLIFGGMEMSLELIYRIWLASADADVMGGATVRKLKFTHDHFNLNSYLKMRVFLALQIPSQNTIKMIRDHCANPSNLANIEDFQPMIDLFNKVDRLVDIMNGTGFKGKDRKVELINKPRHHHIFELFDILKMFEEWKREAGGYTKKFITSYTHEDLIWMVFGVAAHAALYLNEDGTNVMHQGRSGTDVCEHFFSMIRYINSNPTMQQAREGASKVSGGSGMYGKAFMHDSKANSGKAPSATAEELMAPIDTCERPSKKSKKE